MPPHRLSEPHASTIPPRRDRFFERDSYWYYTTREGVDIGPFDKKTEAKDGCAEFIEFINGAGEAYISTLQQYASHAA